MAVVAVAAAIAVAVAIVVCGCCCASLKINGVKGILIPIVIHNDACAVLLLLLLVVVVLLLRVVLLKVCGCNCWVDIITIITRMMMMSEGSR